MERASVLRHRHFRCDQNMRVWLNPGMHFEKGVDFKEESMQVMGWGLIWEKGTLKHLSHTICKMKLEKETTDNIVLVELYI